MSILQKLVTLTEGVEGLSNVSVAMKKLIDANGALETTAAASQLAAELAITSVVNATVRTSMSFLRLGLAISGQIWKWEALSWAAGATAGISAGQIIDWVNDQHAGSALYDLTHADIDPATSTAYRASRTFIERRDPLALDLDGDGLETTGIDGSRPTQFDHDGDGLRTGTGWLQGDDAFLALDRNNNGKIDNGSELFGVDTVLATGPNAGQTAANGFAALADLDSNHDGLFNALDKQYDSVRLWRDGNQDGLSQTDELTALSDAGITSINLASTATNIALPGGNVQSAAGTYTRSNGQTGRVGDFTTGASGNLDLALAQNPFYSTFTDPLPLTAAAQTLPGLHGSGQVRDLQAQTAHLEARFGMLKRFNGFPNSVLVGVGHD